MIPRERKFKERDIEVKDNDIEEVEDEIETTTYDKLDSLEDEVIDKEEDKDAIVSEIDSLTHTIDIEGEKVPSYCFVHDITNTFGLSDDEAIKIAKDNGYIVYKVVPNDADIESGLVIADKECSKDLIVNDYKKFFGVEIDIEDIVNDNEPVEKEVEVEVEEEPKEVEINKEVKDEVVEEGLKSEIPEKSSLIRAMDRFDANYKYAKQGSWSIGHGGYDLSFEIYFDQLPVIDGIRGIWDTQTRLKLCVDKYGMNYGRDYDTLTLAKFICSKWDDCFIENTQEDEDDDLEEDLKSSDDYSNAVETINSMIKRDENKTKLDTIDEYRNYLNGLKDKIEQEFNSCKTKEEVRNVENKYSPIVEEIDRALYKFGRKLFGPRIDPEPYWCGFGGGVERLVNDKASKRIKEIFVDDNRQSIDKIKIGDWFHRKGTNVYYQIYNKKDGDYYIVRKYFYPNKNGLEMSAQFSMQPQEIINNDIEKINSPQNPYRIYENVDDASVNKEESLNEGFGTTNYLIRARVNGEAQPVVVKGRIKKFPDGTEIGIARDDQSKSYKIATDIRSGCMIVADKSPDAQLFDKAYEIVSSANDDVRYKYKDIYDEFGYTREQVRKDDFTLEDDEDLEESASLYIGVPTTMASRKIKKFNSERGMERDKDKQGYNYDYYMVDKNEFKDAKKSTKDDRKAFKTLKASGKVIEESNKE